MTLASGGSLIFPLVVHQLASRSIWPAGSVHKSRGDSEVRMWMLFVTTRSVVKSVKVPVVEVAKRTN